MDKLVSELFQLVEKAEKREDKIRLLKTHDFPVVRAMFSLNYNPSFKLNLPEGAPPFRRETDKPMGYQQTSLLLELRRFYVWMDPNVTLPKVKRETLFIEMLEGLHFTEADIVCAVKDGRLTTIYPSLTESLVREAYPDIFPFPPKEEEEPKKLESLPKSTTGSATKRKSKSQKENVGQT
jgi:hypothetical protein